MRDWPPKPEPRYGRAVFLDRDGTINVDTHYPYRVESLRFVPNAIIGLRLLSVLPIDIIVVSNQAGIALGLFTRDQMSRFNAHLRCLVEQAGARIDAFYFCPHLEAKHLPSGVSTCECSKPAPGMLLEAAREFGVDLSKSFMIGDKSSDVAAGAAAQCVTILVETGTTGREEGVVSTEPRHSVRDLYDAALVVQRYFEHEAPRADII